MTSTRPYRDARTAGLGDLGEVERCAGTQFQPEIAEAFVAAFEAGEIGTGECEAAATVR